MTWTVVTASQRPDLAEVGVDSSDVWPEYNLHGDVLNVYWSALWDELPDYQALVLDESGRIVAEVQTAPLQWNGTDEDLPEGIDAAIRAAVDGHRAGAPVSALCALAAEVSPDAQGKGLASFSLEAMRSLAAAHGLASLIAPVRPSWKHRYPITPIEEYVTWTGADGLSLDPWMRVHQRAGGRIARVDVHGMRISGTVGEWESWTGLPLPRTGRYVFPDGLAPLDVDRERDEAVYYEPNVWIVHDVPH